jgi:hypothetical protein
VRHRIDSHRHPNSRPVAAVGSLRIAHRLFMAQPHLFLIGLLPLSFGLLVEIGLIALLRRRRAAKARQCAAQQQHLRQASDPPARGEIKVLIFLYNYHLANKLIIVKLSH